MVLAALTPESNVKPMPYLKCQPIVYALLNHQVYAMLDSLPLPYRSVASTRCSPKVSALERI